MNEKKTIAAIDIGSNAIRLLINFIESTNGSVDFNKAAYVRVPIRLGEDVFTIGRVGDVKKEQLLEAMQGFAHLIKAYNVDEFRACATSAMREASNSKEIVEYIREKSGIKIQVISGKKEADTIFAAGALNNLMQADKNYMYVDVGGGSTEVVVYSNNNKIDSKSFPLGTVRMLSNAVDDVEVLHFQKWLKKIKESYAPVCIIGSGGNINKIQKIMGKTAKDYVSYSELKSLYDKLSGMSYEDRISKVKLNSYRADVIMPAMTIFMMVCQFCNVERIIVPMVGLADGIIHELYYASVK